MTPRIDPAEYALGLLDGADLAEARRLEESDPAFAAEVRALGGVGARLSALEADEWDAAGPPPLRVDAATLSPAPTPAARPRESWIASLRDRLGSGLNVRPVFAAACAVVLLGIGVGAGLLAAGGDDQPHPPARWSRSTASAPAPRAPAAARPSRRSAASRSSRSTRAG